MTACNSEPIGVDEVLDRMSDDEIEEVFANVLELHYQTGEPALEE